MIQIYHICLCGMPSGRSCVDPSQHERQMTFGTLASSSPSRVAGNHTACSRLTVGAIALGLSVDYRSHRPPAAIDDVGTVLFYPTLSELADPGRVFVAGESGRRPRAPPQLPLLWCARRARSTRAAPPVRLRTSRGPAGGGRTTSATAALRSRSPSIKNEK